MSDRVQSTELLNLYRVPEWGNLGEVRFMRGGNFSDVSPHDVRNLARVQFDYARTSGDWGAVPYGHNPPLPGSGTRLRVDNLEYSQNSQTRSSRFEGRVTGPARAFLSVLDRWSITRDEGAVLLGEDDPALIDDLRSGAAGLRSRDRTDRVRHILKTYVVVNRLLRDQLIEQEWIRRNRTELGSRSLLDTMLGGSIEDLLCAEEFVEEFANR